MEDVGVESDDRRDCGVLGWETDAEAENGGRVYTLSRG